MPHNNGIDATLDMSDNNPSSTGFKADVNHEALLQTVSFMFFFGFTVLLWKIFYQYFTEKTRARRLELINAVVDSQRVSEEVKWDDAPPPSYDEVMADSSKFQTVSNV